MMNIKFPKQLLQEVKGGLDVLNVRLSIAESVTAGHLQLCFAQMENAADVFAGGITAYTIDEKVRILHVDPHEAKKYNCVSSDITEQMAREVSMLFHTDWGIATTGYATPVKESNGRLYAFFSISYKRQIVHTEKIELPLETNAEEAQYTYALITLKTFHKIIMKDTI